MLEGFDQYKIRVRLQGYEKGTGLIEFAGVPLCVVFGKDDASLLSMNSPWYVDGSDELLCDFQHSFYVGPGKSQPTDIQIDGAFAQDQPKNGARFHICPVSPYEVKLWNTSSKGFVCKPSHEGRIRVDCKSGDIFRIRRERCISNCALDSFFRWVNEDISSRAERFDFDVSFECLDGVIAFPCAWARVRMPDLDLSCKAVEIPFSRNMTMFVLSDIFSGKQIGSRFYHLPDMLSVAVDMISLVFLLGCGDLADWLESHYVNFLLSECKQAENVYKLSCILEKKKAFSLESPKTLQKLWKFVGNQCVDIFNEANESWGDPALQHKEMQYSKKKFDLENPPEKDLSDMIEVHLAELYKFRSDSHCVDLGNNCKIHPFLVGVAGGFLRETLESGNETDLPLLLTPKPDGTDCARLIVESLYCTPTNYSFRELLWLSVDLKRLRWELNLLKDHSLFIASCCRWVSSEDMFEVRETLSEILRTGHPDDIADFLCAWVELLAMQVSQEERITFFKGCSSGSREDVNKILSKNAEFFVHLKDEQSQTGLLLACLRRDWDVAMPVARLLLEKGAVVTALDEGYFNVFHGACWLSSVEIVEMLFRHGPNLINVPISYKHPQYPVYYGQTPLHFSCDHDDIEEGLKIVKFLLKNGAVVEPGSGIVTPFLLGLPKACPEFVNVMLANGANVHARREDGKGALHLACSNGVFGQKLIPLLVAAGADVTAVDNEGVSVIEIALQSSGVMVQSLIPYLPPSYTFDKGKCFHYCEADPVGSLVEYAKFGKFTWFEMFPFYVDNQRTIGGVWSHLRTALKDRMSSDVHDVFAVLKRSGDPVLWKWASSEPFMQQHPNSGNTMFHILCETNSLNAEQKLEVLRDLKAQRRNPLTPNYKNQKAIDLCTCDILRLNLQTYMEWKPEKLVMYWFGPVFRDRVFALLLSLKRIFPGKCKDVVGLIIKHLAKVESIYVFGEA